MSKNFVALEQKICVITGKLYSTDAVLLRKDMREVFDNMYSVTGYGICPEEREYIDKGYIALVEIIPGKDTGSRVTPENANRTGRIARIRRKVAEELFDLEIQSVMYIDEGAMEYLQTLQADAE